MGNHPESEYYEVGFFLEAGHQVFSIGQHLFPEKLDEKKLVKQFKLDDRLHTKFWDLHPNYEQGKLIKLNTSFIEEFDLVVMSDYPEHLSLNFREIFNCKKKAVWVWRRRPKATPKHFHTVQNLRGKGLRSLELPTGGRYKITECHQIWMTFFETLEPALDNPSS